ncbi:MAG: DUF4351 domain-containing protein [Isosphaeraceae bacterium]
MRESVTYQRVLNEGRAEEGRKIILRQATRRFGPPSEPTRARLEAVSDLDRLEALADRVLTAVDWDDLFAEAQGS